MKYTALIKQGRESAIYPETSRIFGWFNSFWGSSGFKIPEPLASPTKEVVVRTYVSIVAVEILAKDL